MSADPFGGLTVGFLRSISGSGLSAVDFLNIDWSFIKAQLADMGLLTPDVSAGIDFLSAQDLSFWQSALDQLNEILATYPDTTLLSEVFGLGGSVEEDLAPLDLPDTPPPPESNWDEDLTLGQISSPLIEYDDLLDRWEIGVPDGIATGVEWLFDAAKEEAIGKAVGAFLQTATDALDSLGQRFGLAQLGQQIRQAAELYDTLTSFHTRVFAAIDDVWEGRITLQEYDARIEELTDGFVDRLGEQVDPPFDSFIDGLRLGVTYSNSFNLVYGFEDGLQGLDTGDALVGGGLADSLSGRGGDDLLAGRGGDDTLVGGTGADLLAGGAGSDSLTAGEGADRSYGQGGDDRIGGDAGDDQLFGNAGADWIDGGTGSDTIRGHFGNDDLAGGDGDDEAFGGAGDDSIAGGAGNDLLNGNSGNDTVRGGAGDDSVRGQGGADFIDGGDGNDQLSGHQGFDTLDGGAGNDVLIGGQANDTLIGGGGADIFVFGDGHGADRIIDFEDGIDLIRVPVASFEDIVRQDGANGAVVTWGDMSTEIGLDGIGREQLSAADFLFA